jgi:hypothetical protein
MMTLEQLNEQLSKLCSVPEGERTQYQIEAISEIEQLIDARTMESNQ